jgi:outer membrane protein OmpA-like peptidoglycan-associated protein
MRNRVSKSAWLLALCLPTLALSQQQPRGDGTWEFSAGGGVKMMDRPLLNFLASGSADTRFTNTLEPARYLPSIGARLGYNFSPHVGMSIGGEASNSAGVRYLTPFVALTLTSNLNAKISPFISIGSQFTRVEGLNERVTHPTWGAHFGAGIRSMISDHVALRLEGRMATEHFALLPGKKAAYPAFATLGLSYFVRGRRPWVVQRPAPYVAPRVDTLVRYRVDTLRARPDTVREQVYIREPAIDADQLVLRVQFRTNGSELLSKSLPVLDTIAQAISATPDSRWEVQGHTDSFGSDELNKKLAQDRAQSVVDYLVTKGVNRNNLTATGFGEARPVFSNTTLYGRAQNRRVQLRRVPPPPTGQPVP